MKRLFVKIKTDPKLVGTLFEINGESEVCTTVDKIVYSMEGLEKVNDQGQCPDYRLVRLGSPNRVLDNKQTFGAAHIRNSDVLLMTKDADINTFDGQFNFEPLSVSGQYISVQDLRAPIRTPLDWNSGGKGAPVIINSEISLPQVGDAILPKAISTETKNLDPSSFEFQPLDIDYQKEDQTKGSPEIKPDSSSSKRKKKIAASDV